MTATDPIVVEGPGPADLIALVAGSVAATAVVVVAAFWLANGAPVPASLSGRWWLWWLPENLAAIIRATRRLRRQRRMHPLEQQQEAETLPLPGTQVGGYR